MTTERGDGTRTTETAERRRARTCSMTAGAVASRSVRPSVRRRRRHRRRSLLLGTTEPGVLVLRRTRRRVASLRTRAPDFSD